MSELNQNQSFNYSSFSEFCFHKDELPPETRHTVEVLLRVAGTDDYLEAERVLLNEKELTFEYCEISDLSPFATLTNLTHLRLLGNEISNLNPLQKLTNLTHLELSINKISDITPLQNLTNLTELSLSENQISDITPLNQLTKLIVLVLDNNQITDIKSLSKLIYIEELDLYDNKITDISSLSLLENLQELELENNLITDISPLKTLKKLIYLSLYSNNISDLSPLNNLENLNILSVSRNKVSDLTPLYSLDKLSNLDTSYNKITDLKALQPLKHINELDISGNPISGLVSPKSLIDKYKKLLSIPLNIQKTIESVMFAYTNIGLEEPKVIIANNYNSFYTEAINFLASNNKNHNKDRESYINQKIDGKATIRYTLYNKSLNFLHQEGFPIKKEVIQKLIQKKFNNSEFIQQIHLLSQAIQFHLASKLLCESSLGKYSQACICLNNITPEHILRQIYLIETYQSLLKIPLDEKTQQWYDCLNQLFEHCGWFIPFEDVCIVCDRPK